MVFFRFHTPDPRKHSRLQDKGPPNDSHSVNSKDDSLRISPPHSDITYDTVYDLQGESPFRRSQRLIQTGSANSWRHGQTRRVRSDTTDSSSSDFTWRGVIGGKIEVLNTELRHPYPDQPNGGSTLQSERSAGSDVMPRTIKTRCEVHHEIPLQTLNMDGIYQLPVDNKLKIDNGSAGRIPAQTETRFSRQSLEGNKNQSINKGFVSQSLPRSTVSPVQQSRRATIERSSGLPQSCDVEFPESRDQQSFLELRTSRNSESNEENIYATIKKQFQKIKEDLAEEARKRENNEEDMMYSVRLTDL